MPPLNLAFTVYGRPVKPVSIALMITMIIIGVLAIFDLGVMKNSLWGDVIGAMAFTVVGFFVYAGYKNSQTLAEWALIGAFFIWGFRFWAISIIQGWNTFTTEGWYFAACWMLLSGGSWLLERSDPNAIVKNRGVKWTRG